MRLISNAFDDGGLIPSRYSREGQNWSPPFSWSDSPPHTLSFALLCEDPDAPGGIWHHWALFDIHKDQRALAMNVSRKDMQDGPRQAENDFNMPGYDGPFPPKGEGFHRYRFRLLALSLEHLPVGPHPTCADVAAKAKDYTLGAATLTGRYER